MNALLRKEFVKIHCLKFEMFQKFIFQKFEMTHLLSHCSTYLDFQSDYIL
jgi:hypothetical protein